MLVWVAPLRWEKCAHNWGTSGLENVNDTVANATNMFSLATKSFGLVTKVATRFLYALDLNYKSKVKTNISYYLALLSS